MKWALIITGSGAFLGVVSAIMLLVRHENISPFVLVLSNLALVLQLISLRFTQKTIALQEKRIALEKEISQTVLDTRPVRISLKSRKSSTSTRVRRDG